MKTFLKFVSIGTSLVLLTGCQTVMEDVGQKVAMSAAGIVKYTPPTYSFSAPDTGMKLNASSPAAFTSSLNQILRPMSSAEKKHFMTAFHTVAKVGACKEHGYASWPRTQGFPKVEKRPERACTYASNVTTFSSHADLESRDYLTNGRLDGNRVVVSKYLLGGGEKVSGWNRSTSIFRFVEFSGPSLDGMTRDDINTAYLKLLEDARQKLPKDRIGYESWS